MRYLLISVAAMVLTAGCSDRLDTSDPGSFAKSVATLTADMTPDTKALFDESLLAIAFDTADLEGIGGFMTNPHSPLVAAALQGKAEGRTGPEIIKMGTEIRLRKIDEELARGMASLQRAKAERDRHQSTLDGVKVTGARYYVSRGYIDEPTIAFTITNDTPTAIRRVFLHGTLTSPGRTLPWVDEPINYEFPGGLEPGESKQLALAPNMFGPWGNADYSRRDDLELRLAVVNLEGPQGEPLLTGDPGETASLEREMNALQQIRNELEQRLQAAS